MWEFGLPNEGGTPLHGRRTQTLLPSIPVHSLISGQPGCPECTPNIRYLAHSLLFISYILILLVARIQLDDSNVHRHSTQPHIMPGLPGWGDLIEKATASQPRTRIRSVPPASTGGAEAVAVTETRVRSETQTTPSNTQWKASNVALSDPRANWKERCEVLEAALAMNAAGVNQVCLSPKITVASLPSPTLPPPRSL